MTVRIWVEQQNGQFVATLIGELDVKAVGVTREQAVAAIRVHLREHGSVGRVILVDVAATGSGGISKDKGDPPLREISEEAQRSFDEGRAAKALEGP